MLNEFQGDALVKGFLNRVDTAIELRTTITKSLKYFLPATYLSEIECKEIIKPNMIAALPKMRIPRNVFGRK